jgi:C1A family cysteine protease
MEKTKKETIAAEQAAASSNSVRPIRLTRGGYRIISEVPAIYPALRQPLSLGFIQKRMGWLPDVPDFRDYSFNNDSLSQKDKARGKTRSIKEMVKKARIAAAQEIPDSVDLREWFSPVEDQGDLGSCTAHACVGIYEYFERRAFGSHIDGSHLFLYKATRNLMHETGDTGAYLRSTMGAMALFGIPPEEFWPYEINRFDEEPSAFCYAYGQSYQAISYCRLDQTGMTQKEILDSIKRSTAGGLPAMFGFTVYDSIYQAETTGRIPFPAHNDEIIGGHAVAIAGYDDDLVITNSNANGPTTKGAFIIRNSWGTGFGDGGYCYLPYEFVKQGIADDFWIMMKGDWIDTNNFKI